MNNKTLISIAILFTIYALTLALVISFNVNVKQNEDSKEMDLQINTAHAYIHPGYTMAWHGGTLCNVCEEVFGGCEVSSQCCFSQPPYCN